MTAAADVLVVMARLPVPGAVKTRLAAQVGAAAACALYDAFLADIATRFAAGPWSLVWAVTPPDADLGPAVRQHGAQIPQEGADLAERMHRVFTRLLRGGTDRVVMIGADAPHIADAALASAFGALAANDAVLMPARDGGYCLVGLRAPHDIFSGIPMGTGEVFARTRQRLRTLGLSCHMLVPSFDVDELADVVELARLIERGAITLPETATILGEWKSRGVFGGPRSARP